MFFHLISDGAGGYYAYSFHDDMGGELYAIGGFLALLIGPLFTVIAYGQQLLFPTAILFLGLLLLYTPGSYSIEQSTLLVYSKAAISVPVIYYSIATWAVALAQIGNSIVGTKGFLVLMTFLIMFVPILALVVVTYCVAAPALLLWLVTYIGASNGSTLYTSKLILHLCNLEIAGVFIFGVVKFFMEKRHGKFYLFPKVLAFFMGFIPLLAGRALAPLPPAITFFAILALYPVLYLIYCFLLKQSSVFADFLLFPFLFSLCAHVLVTADMSYAFPSEIIMTIRNTLASMPMLYMPAYWICTAYSTVLTDILHQIVVLICKVVPELTAPARFNAMPPFWGFVGTVGLNALLCLGLGSLFDKLRRKKAQIC